MMESPPALVLEDVSKRFGRVQAVDHLSLQVEPGHLAGFSGRTERAEHHAYMIPRLVRPTTGASSSSAWISGRITKRPSAPWASRWKRRLFMNTCRAGKLELAARLLDHVSAREIDEILERIGLVDRQHDRVRVYSTGMKQRLGIGRALLGRPRLLILDEPTNGMDPEEPRSALVPAREIRNDRLTIFISSHLMSEIEEFCDSVFVINRGHLVLPAT